VQSDERSFFFRRSSVSFPIFCMSNADEIGFQLFSAHFSTGPGDDAEMNRRLSGAYAH
jgi:hypothetical protein